MINQFVIYSVVWKSPISKKIYPWSQAYQTFGEALDACCKTSHAKEILSINNNENCFKDVIHICFNDSDDEYYITPCLFTFHKELPIIENDDIWKKESVEYRKVEY